jgi:MoaA/NifB/PqqE/SkfB family radical SAM enzyme
MRAVFINTGYACSLNCLTCPVNRGTHREYIQPQLQTLLSYIGECRNDQIYLAGGDPALRADLLQIIEAASMNCNCFSLYTSGVRLMDRQFLLTLTGAGLKHLSVPLFSHVPDVHDTITQTKTSFARTSEGLRNILLLKKSGCEVDVEMSITLTSFNYAALQQTVAHIAAEFMPKKVIIVQPEAPGEASGRQNSLRVDIRSDMQPLLQAVEVCHRFGQDVSLKGVPLCWMDRAHTDMLARMPYSPSNVTEIVKYGISSEKMVVPMTLRSGPCSDCIMSDCCSISCIVGACRKHDHLSPILCQEAAD